MLKSEIIWSRTGQVIGLQNDIDDSERPCISRMIDILKHLTNFSRDHWLL